MTSYPARLALFAFGLLAPLTAPAKNPLFFGADPSALVAPDGRLYVYPTTDEPIWDDQVDWHVWSTDDLVNWTDHGVIFSNQDSGWGSNNAWAPDCAYRNGKYYFYYYFNKGQPGGGVGVATADTPWGPFKEALGHRLLAGHDPAIFVDEDGQAYLYVQTSVYKLGPDMVSLKGGKIDLDIDYRPQPFEAAYVFKRNGAYYYTKAAEFNRLIWYTGASPLGPFKFGGEIMSKYGGNNHHSIVQYRGRWILFYHGWVPGRHRMIRAEWLTFKDDGSIVTTPITEEGTGPFPPPAAAPVHAAAAPTPQSAGHIPPAAFPRVAPPIYVNDLMVHDPFIFADPKTRLYYCYAGYNPQRDGPVLASPHGRAGVKVYQSKDLVKWTGPQLVFEIPGGFWGDGDSSPWAPEVHAYQGKYYLFTTFNAWKETLEVHEGRPPITKRASQILVGDSPLGPFQPFANRPHTPAGQMTLDATFYVEDGQPYIVYCHEWVQTNEGTIEALRLTPDLSATVGEPLVLLNAADFPWTAKKIEYRGRWPGRVTDGPFFHRMKNGTLAMLWASHSENHLYAQDIVYSPSGKLAGPWRKMPQPVLWDDRGHGMLFTSFVRDGKLKMDSDGKLLLVLHRYFKSPATRVQIFEAEDARDEIKIGEQLFGAP